MRGGQLKNRCICSIYTHNAQYNIHIMIIICVRVRYGKIFHEQASLFS